MKLLKKHIAFLIASLILFSQIGLALNVHYCGQSIAKVSVSTLHDNTTEKDCCGVVIQKSSCCKDKQLKFEKKEFQSSVSVFSFDKAFFIVETQIPQDFKRNQDVLAIQKSIFYHCEANAPPLYQLYSQYIFYA